MFSHLLSALELARERRGFCAPNPAVGAVIVKDGCVIATGAHWAAGLPHAEVDALSKLTLEESKDATVYVTLEPCCHWGKTPPCTDLLIQRQVKEVFYGFQDPNPQVAGQGHQALLSAGIKCTYLPSPEIDTFYASYVYWQKTGRPFVTAKLALSLNGCFAGSQGEPVAITGIELQHYTHQQRKYADAIFTTGRTIKADDPLLNVRLEGETYAKPVYVLDNQSLTPPTARIFNSASSVTLIQKKDLPEVLDFIGSEGIHDLWVEAGAQCFSALVQQQLVQRVLVYVAPKWLDGMIAPAFDGKIFEQALSKECKIIGKDVVFDFRLG